MTKNRWAVSSYFFINGLVYGNWTSRLPEIQAFFGVSNKVLGTILLFIAVGAIVAMPFTGWLNHRVPGDKITRATGFIFCLLIPLLVISNTTLIVMGVFLIFGVINGAMDVAMNGQAVYVERAYHKPIMSSFHALFSVGMAAGAGVSAALTKIGLSLNVHFISLALFSFVLLLFASRFLVIEEVETSTSEEAHFKWPTKAILPLGLIAFCGMTGEASMADWSAIYITKELKESEFFGAIAIGIFSSTMTVGRIFGDYITGKVGKQNLLIIDSLMAITGLALVLFSGEIILTLLGLAIVGLGLSTVVPIIYGMAGNAPGVRPSVGIAMATTVGYAGFFIGPPVIGFLADSFNLRVGLAFSMFLFVIMLAIIFRYKPGSTHE